MPNEDNKTLRFNHGENSLQVPFIMYGDLECLVEKIDTCQNNNDNSYTKKKAKHTPSGYSLVTCCSFDESKNKVSCYRGKDCLEMLTKKIIEQAIKIINNEKKKEITLTNKEKESYEKQEICYICEKEFCTDEKHKEYKDKKKSEIIVIIQKNLEELLTVVVI